MVHKRSIEVKEFMAKIICAKCFGKRHIKFEGTLLPESQGIIPKHVVERADNSIIALGDCPKGEHALRLLKLTVFVGGSLSREVHRLSLQGFVFERGADNYFWCIFRPPFMLKKPKNPRK